MTLLAYLIVFAGTLFATTLAFIVLAMAGKLQRTPTWYPCCSGLLAAATAIFCALNPVAGFLLGLAAGLLAPFLALFIGFVYHSRFRF